MAIEEEGREDAQKMTAKQKKIAKVMHEFKSGSLKSSGGQAVANRKQAIAIALSEAGLSRGSKSDAYWDAYVSQVEKQHASESGGECSDDCEMDEGAAEARCRGYLNSLSKQKAKK